MVVVAVARVLVMVAGRRLIGNSSDSIGFENKISNGGCHSYTDSRSNDGEDGACGSEHGAMEEDECDRWFEEIGDNEEIYADEVKDECEEGEIIDDDHNGEQSEHHPEADQEDNVMVEGEAVDGEGKVIKREEPGGEEDDWPQK